ncbi:MAG: crossover junction endodeoxyribonuclease RuvC [Candidatus Omnitrophica bacterium]|nr:crossover junction endodeoxyribonuclease RuvC [Candidatus Omnitrophota bacterium]MBU1924448.1 crossover junction endodeoxyribonuclease RuvC [Candidatus Omnitrophota bacterium]
MRVLGVDPGLGCTGYGIIESVNNKLVLLETGTIRTCAKDRLPQRLNKIYRGLMQIAKVFQPQFLAVEELYSHYKNPRTAIIMAHARGVICLVASYGNMRLVGYSAKRVKMAVTGSGQAKKMQVQKVVRNVLGLKKEIPASDIADALALAITHINAFKRIKY